VTILSVIVVVATFVVADEPQTLVEAVAAIETASIDYPDCRAGVGVVHNPITTYNINSFNLGWYVDWRTPMSPVTPEGMEYYFTIRVKQDVLNGEYLPTYTVRPSLHYGSGGLGEIVMANPGAVWLVGNEPDVETQDRALPEKYAEIYHEVYTFIKDVDETAQVAIGAVVQPTPLRLEYLDRVLTAYEDKYGIRLPVDVWNTHLYIMREVHDDWGAKIPPGIDADTGRLYSLSQHVGVEELKNLVRELRVWMKARGYQDKPLIVTEYGALMPLWFLDDDGVTKENVHEFLRDATDWLFTATDSGLGYPADGYRLVQRSALWSLDADDTFPEGYAKWDFFLFRSTDPYTMTETGVYYRDIIAPRHTAYVDLLPYRTSLNPSTLIVASGETISTTVSVLVSNAGSSVFDQPVTIRFRDVTGGADNLLDDVELSPFTGCGSYREVTIPFPDLSPGVYQVHVEIDPDHKIAESRRDNNEVTIAIFVGTEAVYLPLTMSNW